MRQRALQARAEGRLGRGRRFVAARCCGTSPGDWQYRAGAEGRPRAANTHYSESDPAFRRAARALPDAEWFAHYAGLFTYHTTDLSRLAGVPGRAPCCGSGRTTRRSISCWAMCCSKRRSWTAAERHLGPGDAVCRHNCQTARCRGLYQRAWHKSSPTRQVAGLRGRAHQPGPQSPNAAPRHRAGFPAQPRPAVPRARRRGASAARPRGPANSAMRHRVGRCAGTLGCFLSHASAWETMLARGPCRTASSSRTTSCRCFRCPPGLGLLRPARGL